MKSSQSTKTLNAFFHSPEKLPPALRRIKDAEGGNRKKKPQALGGSRKDGSPSRKDGSPSHKDNIQSLGGGGARAALQRRSLAESLGGHKTWYNTMDSVSFNTQEPFRFENLFQTAKRRVEKKTAAARWAPDSMLRTCRSTASLFQMNPVDQPPLKYGSVPALPSLTESKEPAMLRLKPLEDAPGVQLSPRPLPGTTAHRPLPITAHLKLQYADDFGANFKDDKIPGSRRNSSSSSSSDAKAKASEAENREKPKQQENSNTAAVEAPKSGPNTSNVARRSFEAKSKEAPSENNTETKKRSQLGRQTLAGFTFAWNDLDDASGFSYQDAQSYYVTFKQALQDGDNEVDKEELPMVITTLGYHNCDKEAIQRMSDEITHYPTLTFEQFLKFMRAYMEHEKAEWQKHFDKFDEDKSGEIGMEELKLVLMDVGYTPLREMLVEAMAEVDSDGSGQIDVNEFMKLIEHYRETEGFTKSEYQELQELFKRYDLDNDGQIQSNELHCVKKNLGLKGLNTDEQDDVRPMVWKGFLAQMRRYYEAEIKFFKQEFEAFDADKSGQIGTTELFEVLSNLGFTPLKKMLDEVIAIVDEDGTGELDFHEFIRMMWLYRRSEGFTREEVAEMQKVFNKFDVDKSGEISIMELGDMLRYLGFVPKLTEVQKLVDEFDVDGSGDVSFSEILKIMRRFREDEMKEFKHIFKRYDKDKSGSMETHEIGAVLRAQGHEVNMTVVQEVIDEVDVDNSGSVEWNEFVVLMDKYRRMAVKDKRRRCGFTDAEVVALKLKWQPFDADGSNDLNNQELCKLLADLHMEPRTAAEQRHILQLLAECRTLAEEEEGKTTFWVFLRLMRFLEDDKDRNSLSVERKAVEEAKFNKEEVAGFREIFLNWASTDAKKGLGSKDVNTIAPDGMYRMLKSMGMTLTGEDRENLFKMAKAADCDGNGMVDFPDFLILMRRLLDADFCGLNKAAETAATKKK